MTIIEDKFQSTQVYMNFLQNIISIERLRIKNILFSINLVESTIN
jgi:hypothetical protein